MPSAPGDRVVSTGVGCCRTSTSCGAAGGSAPGARLAPSTPTRTASGTTPRFIFQAPATRTPRNRSYFWVIAASIAARSSGSSGVTLLLKNLTTLPSLSSRYLAKFQVRQRAGLAEVAVDRRLLGARLRHELREHREGHAVVLLAEARDLVGRSGLLAAEVVAREAQDHEALVLELVVELLEARILRREAALARDVHDERHLAVVLGEVGGLAGERRGLHGIEGISGHGTSSCGRDREREQGETASVPA